MAARLSGLSYTFRRLRDPCRALRAPLERIMGIEPTFAAWEAAVLPMNYIRVAPCRNCTGAPLRERRACTYGPRLEGRRILRAASAPLVSETGVEPGEQRTSQKPCSHDFRPYCFGVWRLPLGRPAAAVRGKRWKARAASNPPSKYIIQRPSKGVFDI